MNEILDAFLLQRAATHETLTLIRIESKRKWPQGPKKKKNPFKIQGKVSSCSYDSAFGDTSIGVGQQTCKGATWRVLAAMLCPSLTC